MPSHIVLEKSVLKCCERWNTEVKSVISLRCHLAKQTNILSVHHLAFHTYRSTWTASRTWETLERPINNIVKESSYKKRRLLVIQAIKDCSCLQKECLLSGKKYLHLFRLCHFLLQALWGPLGQGLLGVLGLICQAENGDSQSANDSEMTEQKL